MLKILFIQYLPTILYFAITFIIGIVGFAIRKAVNAHRDFLEHQRKMLIQKIGIDAYNHDLAIAQNIIKAIEQMGREYNWEGALKHTKATELISGKTGLSTEEIFNIIKATVGEFNKDKTKVTQENAAASQVV